MNIILNSYCNLKCNYCFADEYMDETVRTPGKSMEFDYFIAEFLPRIQNAPTVNFMGGEPTLHPRFTEIFSQTFEVMQSSTSPPLIQLPISSANSLPMEKKCTLPEAAT